MKISLVLLGFLSLITTTVRAVNTLESQCKSQLIRLEVSNDIFQSNMNSILPLLQKFAERPELPKLLEKSYDIPSIPFPQNTQACLDQKSSANPEFRNINCLEETICSRTDLPPSVKERMCFYLPCPLLEGPLQVGKCQDEKSLYPSTISFPAPVVLKKIKLVPTKSEFDKKNFRLCFRIEELELSASVSLGLDISRTKLRDRDLTVSNLLPKLDGVRNACLSGEINLKSRTPLSKLAIETESGKPFISDVMLYQVAATAVVKGLSGYPEDQIDQVKTEVLPVLFAAFRHIVEDAVKASLSEVISEVLNELISDEKNSLAKDINTQNLMNEISLGSMAFLEHLYQAECSALFEARKPIPPDHECRKLEKFREDSTLGPFMGTYWGLKDILREGTRLNVTSEKIRQRLVDLKAPLLERVNASQEFLRLRGHKIEDDGSYRKYAEKDYETYVTPVIEKISQNQTAVNVAESMQIKDLHQGQQGREIGISIPDTCDKKLPSAHAKRSMANCPVQAYVDLKEVNSLFESMWREGMLCQEGKGPFIPGSPRYDSKNKGRPNGTGCSFEVNAMKCFINRAPKISWDSKAKKYAVNLQLKECFYPGVAGLGDIFKFGGDLSINMSFLPKVCGGDLCIRKPIISVRQVAKTGRFSLDQSDGIPNKDILETLRNGIQKGVSDSLRIPLTSSVQSIASIPLKADGKTDVGKDFFGVCLRLGQDQ